MTTLSPKMQQRRNRIMGIVFLVFAMAILVFFVPSTKSGQMTTFVFDVSRGEALPIGSLTFATNTSLYVMAVLAVFAGAWQLAKGFKQSSIVLGMVAGFFVLAFLSWAARDQSMNITGYCSQHFYALFPLHWQH